MSTKKLLTRSFFVDQADEKMPNSTILFAIAKSMVLLAITFYFPLAEYPAACDGVFYYARGR